MTKKNRTKLSFIQCTVRQYNRHGLLLRSSLKVKTTNMLWMRKCLGCLLIPPTATFFPIIKEYKAIVWTVRYEYMMKNRERQWFLFLPQKAIVLYLYLHYVLHMLDITEEETSSFSFISIGECFLWFLCPCFVFSGSGDT